jgi:hypothetical protein
VAVAILRPMPPHLRSTANVTVGAVLLAIAMFVGIALCAVTHPAATQSAVPAAYASKLYELCCLSRCVQFWPPLWHHRVVLLSLPQNGVERPIESVQQIESAEGAFVDRASRQMARPAPMEFQASL